MLLDDSDCYWLKCTQKSMLLGTMGCNLRFTTLQVNPRAGLGPPVRNMALKGRGRGRWAMGHAGRGAEYPGTQGSLNAGYEYGHYNTIHSGTQELYGGTDLYGLPSLSPYDIGGKQSYSNPMQDAAVLEGFRGNSLGQLSMAGGAGSLVHTGLYGTVRDPVSCRVCLQEPMRCHSTQ